MQSAGKFLKQARTNAGLSQTFVAKHFNLQGPQFISNFERGTCYPSDKMLKGLFELYKLDTQDQATYFGLYMDEYTSKELANIEKTFGLSVGA